jgi:hypothetical protein
MMSTTMSLQQSKPRRRVLCWFTSLASGFAWGLEMRRRYDSELAAGRRPDEKALRRIAGEVDAWQGRRI